ncbi:hypothetical protein AAF712_010363 [Marasmius tenuissimus]|uniref:SGNH hydrolase-type esterase domain-containing protein n=1 Tax=Marasmius tenuissimus TaxID=585030 RepID=A0ABR2ZMD6_9AGAR
MAGVGVAMAQEGLVAGEGKSLEIGNKHPLIHYHGRWDSSPGTWWAGSGFTLNITNLKSLQLELGPNTTQPFAPVSVIVDGGPITTVNASEGLNDIPIPSAVQQKPGSSTVVKFNVQGWQNDRINLKNVIVNSDAKLQPYKPSKLTFQFIGDSLVSGQYLPLGINQAWPYLAAERYGAEYRINSQPGATLTDMVSYGNQHGVSFMFFRTEDTGYYVTQDHNYTTPWNFSRDLNPPTTHVIIHIGANDASQGVTPDGFVEIYGDFLTRIRKIYPRQPIFVFTPWGWPNADGNTYYYYDGQYQQIVDARYAIGDQNVFLVNMTGWVRYEDVDPESVPLKSMG